MQQFFKIKAIFRSKNNFSKSEQFFKVKAIFTNEKIHRNKVFYPLIIETAKYEKLLSKNQGKLQVNILNKTLTIPLDKT